MLLNINLGSSLIEKLPGAPTGVLENVPIEELMNPSAVPETLGFVPVNPVLRLRVENVSQGLKILAVLVSPRVMVWDSPESVCYDVRDAVRFTGVVPRMRLK